ncbi:MAG TPA: leucyl/phenylalanyl-tRNA--protein transferase [Ignavibacteriaceae bacterium]|nr:leucyl/phenylalanyl-tRNA--protein transferase [Ignavibacteriaceae bacterium]
MDNKEKLLSDDLLKPNNMIRLYASGAFPMADSQTGHINWFMPETRCIIPLNKFNIPRSLSKSAERLNYEIRYDSDYLSVIKYCSARKETWISEKIIDAYKRLYKRGHLHTVETWKDNVLVGGLYGITFRGAFFGESMFSLVSQASKIALIHLVKRLEDKNFVLLDVQYLTEHLKMFGAVEINWDEYQSLLRESYIINSEF